MSVREGQDRAATPAAGGSRTDQIHRLASAALLLNSTLSVDELLQVITAQARETIGAHQAVSSMTLSGSWAQAINAVALSERYAEWRDYGAPPDGSGIYAIVCRENRPMRLTQAELEAHPAFRNFGRHALEHPPMRGWLAAPLVGRDGANIGLIQLSDKLDGGDFTAEDEAMLVQLAQMASAAVENARLYERVEQERDRLAAVFRMAEVVGRASSLDQIFDAALAALESAVGATRASILLFDDGGVMRFRAWRGLSDEYRATVDGHSPWRPGDTGAEPILVPDVHLDAELADLLPVFEAEGIRALVFVPLVHEGGVIGKYMLYFPEPHEFADDEIQVAQTIASHLASATQRRRAEDRLRASRAELEAIFRGVADGITVQDSHGRIVYANAAAARLIGYGEAEQLLAAPAAAILERFEILDEHRRPLDLELLPGRRALRGEGENEFVVCYRSRETGEERWSIVRAAPIVGEDGAIRLAINTFHEITDRKIAEDRLRFLSEASAILAGSLDFDETLAQLGRLMVPALADYCLVDLLEPDGGLRLAVLEHVDPGRAEILREIRRRYPPQANDAHPASRVLASNEPLLIPTVDEDVLREAATDDDHFRLYRELDPSSYLVVPLVAGGRTFGTISLGAGDSGRRYGPADAEFVTEVARRIAVAVDNARLYTEVGSSLALLDSLLLSAPVGIGFWDSDLRYVRVNDALATLNGLSPEEHVGKTVREVVPGLADVLEARYRRVLETGEPSVHHEATDVDVGGPGNERHWLTSCYPVRTVDGRTIGVGAVLMEITDRKRADDRLRLLAEAGELFSSSLDRDEIFRRVARVVVPRIADACNIFLANGNGLVRVAYSHVDPERERLMGGMPETYSFDEASPPLVEQVLRRGEPRLVATVDDEFVAELEALGLDAESFRTVGSRSMIFVPFVSRGETLGVMTLGSQVAGRYTESDVELAAELANRASIAIENAALFRELEFRTSVLEAQQESSLDGLLLVAPDGAMVSWNQRFAELWRLPPDVLESGNDAAALEHALTQVRDPEEFIARVRHHYEHVDEVAREEVELRDGRVIDRYGAAVHGPEGEYYGYLWSFRDITEERQSVERLRVLAEASATLASSLDYDATLSRLAQLSVPRLADWCSVAIRDEDGSIRIVGVAHADSEKTRWAEQLTREFPPMPDAPYGIAAVIRTGEPEVVPAVTPEMLEAVARHRPAIVPVLEQLDIRSTLIVPLVARGRTLGAISLAATGDSGRTFGPSELELAQEIARRAAVAVDNALLFKALDDQSRLLTTVTENAASALFMMDDRGHPTYMNQAATEITGYTLDEIRDRPLHYAVHHTRPDGTPYPMEECPIDRAIIREKTVEPYEDLFVRKDGTFFPVRAAASPIFRDGIAVGTVVEFRDITEERRTQEELARRAQAAQALEFVADGVFLLDDGGVVRLWNPAAAAIFGRSEDDVLGASLAEVVPGWTDVSERIPVAGPEARSARAETVPLEVDGRELWLSISGVRFREGTVYAFRDSTEERAVERIKSDFVSTVSHELRTPLAAIYGAAMTLRRQDVPLTSEQREGMLSVVSGEAERLARIVNDILLASRLDSDVVEVAIGRADARRLTEEVLAAAGAHLPPKITLSLHAPDDLPAIAADEDKLRQVLVNLVENAIKYSPDGGPVEVSLAPVGNRMRFSVSDRGLGIPAAEQTRIFEKFYRLDPDLTRGVGGTGLGLYICREIVRRMDGRIWVESAPGAGSTFVFELPLA
ncbi:MAG TPA: GAF domain-containing protein [Gaiellaceae bacterium]|nr:GAF domain-containing protein [Gaiellaceae bacterium]